MAHRKLLNALAYGQTVINISARKVTIDHCGNMGNTVDRSVRPNVDALLGKGVFDKLRKVGTEEGGPDYIYTLTVTMKEYLAAGGKTGITERF